MNRQNTSKRMFGLVMIAVTLLLVACGNGEGDSDPTATTAVNEAAPTLPASDGTVEVQATEDISEEDLTIVDPEIPATAEETEEVSLANIGTATTDEPVGTPDSASEVVSTTPVATTEPDTVSTSATPDVAADSTPVEQATDLTGPPVETSVESTPITTSNTATPPAEEDDATIADPGTPTEEDEATLNEGTGTPSATEPTGLEESTPATNNETAVTASPQASPAASDESGQFNTPGDGTGGSGAPGEPSSNIQGDSGPIVGIAVEGCEVTNVPEFDNEVVDYVTVAEVNFRSGPGTDCDPILEDPLAPELPVTVVGGPVTQTSDDSIWLQVEVDGVPGWVSEEFIEPAG